MKLFSLRRAEQEVTVAGAQGREISAHLEISLFGGGPCDPHGTTYILRMADWRDLSVCYLASLADEVPNASPLNALRFGTHDLAVQAAIACDALPGAYHWSVRPTSVRAELARHAAHRN